jgi:glycosyltransferase involved in cell wall biosynthesis
LGRQIAAKKFDCIIVITEGDLRNYKKIFSKINRIEQIYNPIEVKVDNQEYNPNIKKIMSCGSLVYKKGYDMLIEVANLVLKKHPDWTWEIYGDGIERKKIEQMIFNYGLEGKVILNGYVKDIEKYYNNHSLFVLTSRSEGFGMVLVEAQRHKLPIVSFKCSGPSEIVSNGKNGYLIDCFDIKQMADSICTLIENNDLRCKFSKQSDADLKRFDSKVISKKWEDLIDSL